MNEYIHIGRMVAPFGLKGELILKHALGKKTMLKGIEAVFIEMNKGSYLPYFVESSKAKDHEETYVKLEGIDTRESANRITVRLRCLSPVFSPLLTDASSVRDGPAHSAGA